ncbi:MAG: cysteine desulfurase [Clostridiales bacterium]|nr:cysteine desulfurase [Clostridiales bacterium]
MNRKIYLDNASTTYVSNEVINEMMPCFNTIYGNAGSLHSFGRDAMAIVDRARDRIRDSINANKSNEIYFTSGGTEADNWAILGAARANANKGKHIITSQIEHHAVLHACEQLEKEGFEITYLPVDQTGLVKLPELLHAIRRNETILISIMAVNNEVGTIQNIKAIAKIAHDYGILFHTDAVQAIGNMKIDVQDMEIDLLSMSSHKIHGPKGVGALYVKNGVLIDPILFGGNNQERGKRAGTENVPGIAGFGKAVEIATRNYIINSKKLRTIREYFLDKLSEKVEHFQVNGHPQQKANGILNISFYGIEGESILMLLDLAGICVSTSSACTSKSLLPSHVLKAMNIPDEIAQSSIRISFGTNISKSDVDYVVNEIEKVVSKLRAISPIQAGRI